MQVNSVNFKGVNKDYDNFSKDMHKSIDAIKGLRADLFADKTDEFEYVDDESVNDEPNKKNVLGIAASLAFIALSAYGLTKKGYNAAEKFVNKAKALPQSDNKVVQNILNNKAVKGIMTSADSAKDKAIKLAMDAKNFVLSKMPEKLKSNAVVNFAHDLNLKTSTKVGLVGATAGTVAASRVDNNENGCADMFEKGISLLDGISDKAGKVVEVAKILS